MSDDADTVDLTVPKAEKTEKGEKEEKKLESQRAALIDEIAELTCMTATEWDKFVIWGDRQKKWKVDWSGKVLDLLQTREKDTRTQVHAPTSHSHAQQHTRAHTCTHAHMHTHTPPG
jgi:hypothetical protein